MAVARRLFRVGAFPSLNESATAILRSDSHRSVVCDRHGSRSFHSSPSLLGSSPLKPRISYRIASSFSAKGHWFDFEKNTHAFDPSVADAIGTSLQGPDPGFPDHAARRRSRPSSGQDAFFVSRVGRSLSAGDGGHDGNDGGDVAFAVADGVGGWAEVRVDPADFSHGLCTYMAREALDWDTSTLGRLHAKSLIQRGYDRLQQDRTIVAGGSTACVGIARPDGTVELANLGDSGSVLLRLAAVHHYSAPQTHDFNTPYQLSIIPQWMRMQAAIFGGEHYEDVPNDAAVSTISMQHGDVLVLATDGVFDNLNNQDLLKIVTGRMLLTGAWTGSPKGGIEVSAELEKLTRPGSLGTLALSGTRSRPHPRSSPSRAAHQSLQGLLAASIVGEAKLASQDQRRDGPFAKAAQRYEMGRWYRGGKVDDICVVVVLAVEES